MAAADRTPADVRATRDEVIQAAIRAFAERGYRSASMNAIAAEVGITRQGLLYHFPSKDDLLLAVIAFRDEEEAAELPRQVQRQESLSDIIQAALRRHAVEGETVARLFTVLSAESIDHEHPAHDYFVDRYRRGRQLVTDLIASEQAQGRITSAMPPEQLAIALLALMDGLQLQAHLEPEPLDIDRVASNLMALLSP
jgi:AcrR family transcriptional regulator